MSTVTGNWIGKLVIQTVVIFLLLACVDSPCGVLGRCSVFGVCGWITAIVSLTEQKVNLIQINCRVVRALAPARSQNYSRSHTQSDLLYTFSLAFEIPCPSQFQRHRKHRASAQAALETAFEGL